MNIELTADEIATRQIYDRYVLEGDIDDEPVWVDSFSASVFRHMPGDGEVLDVGCGVGRFIQLLPHLGIEKYFGVDPSVESIRFCRKTFPQYGFEVGDMRMVGHLYPARFSGFLMTTTLMHLPRPELGRALTSLRASLLVGAPGLLSTPFGEGEELEVTNNSGMKLTLFTFEEIQRALQDSGFRVDRLFTPDNWMMLGKVTAI